jgi:hypothetical protein
MTNVEQQKDGTTTSIKIWLNDKTWMLDISAVKDGIPWFIECHKFDSFYKAIKYARDYEWISTR